jgi:Type I phosphodiesterase / nucleotide pyrophosphatase
MAKEANIFILIDALGWEWVKPHPFLRSIAPYRRPLESVLGFSTSCIPSILTGLYPQEHGRLTLFQRAQGRSPFADLKLLCAMPPALVENRYVRYGTKLLARRLNGFAGHFSLYGVPLRCLPMLDVCERNDLYLPGGVPGSTTIFDVLTSRGSSYAAYCYHQGPDFNLIAQMETELANREKSFYFLYLAEIDAFLHIHGDDPAAIAQCLDRYSAALTHLYETARANYGTVRVHVFADHGMAPTVRTVDIQARLAGLKAREPHDYLCLLDSTMARFWFFSPTARVEIMSALSKEGSGQWLSEDALRELKAWFEDRRYGEEIYLMPEGTVIEPSHMGKTAPKGMHGFHPSTLHSKAAFLSSEDYGNGPNHITDLFSLMQNLA